MASQNVAIQSVSNVVTAVLHQAIDICVTLDWTIISSGNELSFT